MMNSLNSFFGITSSNERDLLAYFLMEDFQLNINNLILIIEIIIS
jgi:hypothetical protein